MAECHNCNESGTARNVYPALAVAAIAGIALTYLVVARKARSNDDQLPLDKVVNICNSAAAKLDAFVSHSIAS